MISDSLADRATAGESIVGPLTLWACVLAQGVRDTARAHIKRRSLQEGVKGGGGENLLLAVVTLHNRLSAVVAVQERLQLCRSMGIFVDGNTALKDQEKVIEKMVGSSAELYAGLDEATEWFWSDDFSVGSMCWIYSYFPSLPPIDAFRRLVMRSPEKYAKLRLDQILGCEE